MGESFFQFSHNISSLFYMLFREKESYNELTKERDKLSLDISQLQVSGSEETEELKKSRQEFEDELKKRTEELTECKEKLQAHDQAAKRAIAALQKEMELRIDQVSEENYFVSQH